MEFVKIKNLQKALKDLGIDSVLSPVYTITTTDGTKHRGMELELPDIYDGELETYCFIFTPDGEYVDSWFDCPLVEEQKQPQPQAKKSKKKK